MSASGVAPPTRDGCSQKNHCLRGQLSVRTRCDKESSRARDTAWSDRHCAHLPSSEGRHTCRASQAKAPRRTIRRRRPKADQIPKQDCAVTAQQRLDRFAPGAGPQHRVQLVSCWLDHHRQTVTGSQQGQPYRRVSGPVGPGWRIRLLLISENGRSVSLKTHEQTHGPQPFTSTFCREPDQHAPAPRKNKTLMARGVCHRNPGHRSHSVSMRTDPVRQALSPFPSTDAGRQTVLKCANCGSCRPIDGFVRPQGCLDCSGFERCIWLLHRSLGHADYEH